MDVDFRFNGSDYSIDYSIENVESNEEDDSPLLAPLPSLLPSRSCNTDSLHKWQTTLQLYIYSLVCAVAIAGNIMVILSYACCCCCRTTRKCMTMTDVYLINMAVADLVLAMALPVTIFNERNGWLTMGIAACKFARGVYSIKLYCSALLLAFLSRHRYRHRDSSMPQARERSWVCCLLVSLAIWALAVVLSVPTFIYSTLHRNSLDHDRGLRFVDHNLNQSFVENDDLTVPAKCVFNFNVGDLADMSILVPAQISLGFFLPLLVTGFHCARVTVALLRDKTLWAHEAVCVVLAGALCFAMCHLPYNAALLYHVTNWKTTQMSFDAEKTLLTVMVVTRCVAYVHSCLYPVLYALTAGVFRCRLQRRTNSNRRSASRQQSDLYIPVQTQSLKPEGPDENLSSSTTVC